MSMSRSTGLLISDEMESIHQSIIDILTTPIGSRLMRREYGSLLYDLIDQPINDVLVLKCYSAIYSAILRWEPRISINQISIFSIEGARMQINLEADLIQQNQSVNLSLALNLGAAA
ncbi:MULTISPECIES: GPW/gp25 family protein [unclassified Acinetobacter]|uniref:GPW/gp25 family protein n=1 Tax=unclassified Acinetobacter TaxID=196816 RepID=UPI0019092FEF|nr:MULTISPECIES: GPW/gp25 family protein [unclassified Acinetobacter]MBK0062619.1 GPW/gp25 family protein [Acinetobacter sp. S55]MBK0065804.1 GPW/gp25 family protein [Acinetobacter sp. S54]